MKAHNRPQTAATPNESRAERLTGSSVVSVERTVSTDWTRFSGRGVAPVNEIESYAQRAEDVETQEGAEARSIAGLNSLEEREKPEWRQQTVILYKALAPKLVKFLRNLGINRDEREDVIQEVFLRLAGHLKQGKSEGNLHAWVHQVAHNLAMDFHNGKRRGREEVNLDFEMGNEPIDPRATPEWVYWQKERSMQLQAAMSQLTRQQHNSILLRIQGRRYREIGALLGVSEQRAIHLVKRGLERLRGGR